MLKNNPFMEAYLNIIKEDVDDNDEIDVIDQLEEKGFDWAQPNYDIMIKLLDAAEADPQTVFNKIVGDIIQCDYVEQNDRDENIVTVTRFADFLYTNFPVEVIQDPQFKEDYQFFQNWFDEEGYDGWSGYGDRDGVIEDNEIIDKIYMLFNDFGDGSPENPKIWYDDEDLDGYENSDDEDEDEE